MAIIAIVVVGFPLLMYLAQDSLIFFPQPQGEARRAQIASQPAVESRFIDAADGTRLHAWHVKGEPLVMYFGGNAEEVSWMLDGAARRAPGTGWLLVDYRGYGSSGGSPSEKALVEDNADTRETMVAALELDGHRVYQAADGNAGMRAVAEAKPDVAVIDIGLPGLDGYEVASALRRDPECQTMVLVAITGFEQPDSLRRAREAGFDEYLTKPVPPERLVRLIDAARAARSKKATC